MGQRREKTWAAGLVLGLAGIWMAPPGAGAQIDIFINDQPPAGAQLFQFTLGNSAPLAGAQNLEFSAPGGQWVNGTIQNFTLDMTLITNWPNAYLEFAIRSSDPTQELTYAEAHLISADGTDRKGLFALQALADYQLIQIPLTEFAADRAAFGATLVKWFIGASWPAGMVVIDEVRIVEGTNPASLVVFRESKRNSVWMNPTTTTISTKQPFAGLGHLEALGTGAGTWVNTAHLAALEIDTSLLLASWATAGLSFVVDFGQSDLGYWEVGVTTDWDTSTNTGKQWKRVLRNTPSTGTYQHFALLLNSFADTNDETKVATAATFGSKIHSIRIGSSWPSAPVRVDEIFFTPKLNQWPTVTVTGSPLTVDLGGQVSFSATAADADGTVAEYAWDFADQTPIDRGAALATTSHTFTTPGTFAVRVTVTDDRGGIGVATVDVAVTCPTPTLAVATVAIAGTVADSAVTTILINGVATPVTGGNYQSAPVALSSTATSVALAKSAGDPGAITLQFSRTP